MLRRLSVTLLCLLLLGLGGWAAFWAWGRPREHVAYPGPSASPVRFVRAYVEALDARDFGTSNAMSRGLGDHDRWWSRSETVRHLRIQHVYRIHRGSVEYRTGVAHLHRYTWEVDTWGTWRGPGWSGGDEPVSLVLARETAAGETGPLKGCCGGAGCVYAGLVAGPPHPSE